MSALENTAATTAWDEEAARQWVDLDRARDENQLSLPWKLATAVSAVDVPVTRVLDVASGPGGFLSSVLEEAPEATGVWFDFSQTMKDAAVVNLERFSGRVEYRIGDMTDLHEVGDPESFDLVTTSRATHHLSVGDLHRFYASAFQLLRVGGWIANIDNLVTGDPFWAERLRKVRRQINGSRDRNGSGHPHPVAPPGIDDHLAALRVAGFIHPRIVWSTLISGLLMAQKP